MKSSCCSTRKATYAVAGDLRIVALAGGVGGAKLVQGLAYLLPASRLRIIVNTGDDFEHLGLSISPDVDTVMYTLAGIANPVTGWGIEDETFHCLETVTRLGGPGWFRLGDRDLGLHLLRTQKLRAGMRLTEVTRQFAAALGVCHALLPMTDAVFRTMVVTPEGELPFQEYFVHQQCRPTVERFRWDHEADAGPTPEVMEALTWADVVVFCPSNPYVSLDPILALPGVRDAVQAKPVVAVSPIIGGQAVKGPAAKMLRELEGGVSALAVAARYRELLTGFVLDSVDAALAPSVRDLELEVLVTRTLMPGLEERIELARAVLTFAALLQEAGASYGSGDSPGGAIAAS
jgi:LPPG:FO 2-phospho-L-lactate transferase